MNNKYSDLLAAPFYYEGINRNGEISSGIIHAKNKVLAKIHLIHQGITPSKIRKKRRSLFTFSFKKINFSDITSFTRQLATLLKSGISLMQALTIIMNAHPKREMQQWIQNIQHSMHSGRSFSDALKLHPINIGHLFYSLIFLAEKTGSMDDILTHLAIYYEHGESTRKKIKKALTYPITVLLISLLISLGLIFFIIPQFEQLFNEVHATLPLATRIILKSTQWIHTNIFNILGIFIFLWVLLIYTKKNIPSVTHIIHYTLLKIPIFGMLIQKFAMIQLTRTLGFSLKMGITLTEALKISKRITGNIVYEKAICATEETITKGISLHQSMDNQQLFPKMVIQMIAIGEESGYLEEMLANIARIYEEDVTRSIDAIGDLIEPMMIIILGLLIGGLVIAMYLPVFKLGSVF